MSAATSSSRAKVFYSNRSQAVRLPREVAFPRSVTELLVVPMEGMVMLKPRPEGWEELFDDPVHHAAPDFLFAREEPIAEERDW